MDIGFNPTTWLILAAIMIVIEIITLGLSTVLFAGGAAAACGCADAESAGSRGADRHGDQPDRGHARRGNAAFGAV